jgi:hypothetical protein
VIWLTLRTDAVSYHDRQQRPTPMDAARDNRVLYEKAAEHGGCLQIARRLGDVLGRPRRLVHLRRRARHRVRVTGLISFIADRVGAVLTTAATWSALPRRWRWCPRAWVVAQTRIVHVDVQTGRSAVTLGRPDPRAWGDRSYERHVVATRPPTSAELTDGAHGREAGCHAEGNVARLVDDCHARRASAGTQAGEQWPDVVDLDRTCHQDSGHPGDGEPHPPHWAEVHRRFEHAATWPGTPSSTMPTAAQSAN